VTIGLKTFTRDRAPIYSLLPHQIYGRPTTHLAQYLSSITINHINYINHGLQNARGLLRYCRVPFPAQSSSTEADNPSLRTAIHKPTGVTSAQVIRDVQKHFNPSKLFQPGLLAERARMEREHHNQKQKRSRRARQPPQVKMGHGGTLDPLATGVLILGIGSGTKSLPQFLGCTKSYECTVLFGKATDTYDTEGKVVARKGYEHITKDMVEQALVKFRGKIMQKPPIFSALKVNGKKLYEYAREGKEVPIEIEARDVETETLEMTEWMEGGTHSYHWPEVEAEASEKELANKVLHLDGDKTPEPEASKTSEGEAAGAGEKRKRDETVSGAVEAEDVPESKRTKAEGESEAASGALPEANSTEEAQPAAPAQRDPCPAPACRLRMTVTSGFYVRSLCHDLGAAVNSLGMMASLARTRQGEFELGKNVFEYEDLEKGEEHWAPQIQQMLDNWDPKPLSERPVQRQGGVNKEQLEQQAQAKRQRRNSSSDAE
jgi:tRNA pseudouridine55 synthase